jgi:hypothetical protein
VSLTDILVSDHLPVTFSILNQISATAVLDYVEKFKHWARIQNPISRNMKLDTPDEVDKAVRDFTGRQLQKPIKRNRDSENNVKSGV